MKSQTEIFGLAFIVILISLAVFIGIFFFIGKKPVPHKGVESILAADWLNTALNTVDEKCQQATLRDMYQDCAETGSLRCHDAGKTSCDRAKQITQIMIDNTFEKWSRQYVLATSIPGMEKITNTPTKDCPEERESKTQFIPTRSGRVLRIQLDLCR